MRIREALLVLLGMAVLAAVLAFWRFGGSSRPAASKPLVLQLNWRAQSETGGFVQAVAKGFYRDCGLDVELRQGGPGIDPRQLLVSGAVEAALVPQNAGVIQMNVANFPARAVYATMQHTPASLIVHEDSPIRSVEHMRGKPISISASSRSGWWPFLRLRYGFTDDQIRAFSGQRSAFVANKDAIEQDVITNGPYVIWQQAKLKVRSFRLTDLGYDPYDSLVVVSQTLIDQHPERVRCLVQGSQRGWADFLRDPAPGFAAIRQMSPEVSQGLLEFGHQAILDSRLAVSPDTERLGLGAMTAERWHDHAQWLKRMDLAPEDFDESKVYDTAFLAPPK